MKILWRFKRIIDRYVYDERRASRVRLFFVFCLTTSAVMLGYVLFEDININELALRWKEHFPYLFWIPLALSRLLHFLVYSFRFMIIPVSVFVGILLASAVYVQDVYELPSYRDGLKYIAAALLGIGYPRMIIEKGKIREKRNEVNLIDTIGGPGYVNIRPGNVVLFESLRSPSSVRSKTQNFISRFETVKEIVSLDDQHGFIEETKAKTKDGIELVIKDIHFRFRLRTGRRFGDYEKRQARNPYPYSVQAVKNMAYNRSVRSEGLTSWHSTIQRAVDSGITDYIKSHHFNHLTSPSSDESDPRKDINTAMMKPGIRNRLRNAGAELLWFDIGHFEVAPTMKTEVEDQRIDTWSAHWDGDAMVVRAYGEARRLAYQDLGRAEGQADMLLGIIQALEEADFGDGVVTGAEQKKRLRSILWMRVAQILDVVGEEARRNPPLEQLPSEGKTE